ncbi:GtrA family protein [Phytobacter diazotrophicus]|jgi:putative flippase GtrA|uniref:GtrA family protein n=1 Tax=Phytobacter diazotrophicus TaxID=395631 RepID=UPI00374285A3
MNRLVSVLYRIIMKYSFIRFLLSGGLNTAVTWGLYLLLLNFIGYEISFTISYILGIVLAYIINRFFVFKMHRGLSSMMLFPLIYIFQYLLGLLIVWGWVEILKMGAAFAPLISIIVSIPLTYILTKYVFSGKR